MDFILYENMQGTDILVEEQAFSGVRKIAEKVANDIRLVTGNRPNVITERDLKEGGQKKTIVIAGTIGMSECLDMLSKDKKLDVSCIKGKREVYSFSLIQHPFPDIENALVIVGSDKRGTIYGLFHLSELLNVSPWVDWADVIPVKQQRIVFTEEVNLVSKEPSVKYRGFFINDEWPAFGNWTVEHYGGFNAVMYEKMFELLLRMKGNYLWPAMWSSSFSLDGPGLASAELADEYGVVMGTSHHEPCLRHSEEWDKVRGEDSEYGNAWNYDMNRDGLLRYWKDGLKRSGKFENVITIGMRGERDTSMLGSDATLKENIDLLKDIIKEQRKLIAEEVDADFCKVPQMLALYKEVEQYFYGDEKTEGLIDWDELDNVTFLLCEDNFGNMRTLPPKSMKDHKGGFGMYYHFDYHGGPISYEWVNTSYLPKVWEQMTMAYDFGVRDIWIVNVGDLKLNEFPLSYFMELAYDFDKWGTASINKTSEFESKWIRQQFGGYAGEEKLHLIEQVLNGYTKLNHNRKIEALHAGVYHPVHYQETKRILEEADRVMRLADQLLKEIPKDIFAAFYELIYFPAAASMNVLQMQLYSGLNIHFAEQRANIANQYANKVKECIDRDRQLVTCYHALKNGKWHGMAISTHIGFTNWNEEGCQYPLIVQTEPADKKRILVSSAEDEEYSTGGDWTGKTIHMKQFMQYGCEKGELFICCGSKEPVNYQIVCKEEGIRVSKSSGTVSALDVIEVFIDREKLNKFHVKNPEFRVNSDAGNVKVVLDIMDFKDIKKEENMFIIGDTYTAIEAEHYKKKVDTEQGGFLTIDGYGRTLSAIKAFPSDTFFVDEKDAPYVEYCIYAIKDGEYRLQVYSAPANPISHGGTVDFKVSVNEGDAIRIPTVSKSFKAGECSCKEWCDGVLNQIHIAEARILLHNGKNHIRIYAGDPGFVLEKLVVIADGYKLPSSYLGPEEDKYCMD